MWNDFNSAENQTDFDVIPAGTIAPVRMTIKPGGYDDQHQGWTGGYATCNETTGSVYLSCEFVILAGDYVKRKVWSLIGLHSAKGVEWQNMGRSFIKGIINSAYQLSEQDQSPAAQQKRLLNAIADLDGIEFVAKIDTKKDEDGQLRNEVRFAITPDHRDYKQFIGQFGQAVASTAPVHSAPQTAAPASDRPQWAS